jgi:hypothetical protein
MKSPEHIGPTGELRDVHAAITHVGDIQNNVPLAWRVTGRRRRAAGVLRHAGTD